MPGNKLCGNFLNQNPEFAQSLARAFIHKILEHSAQVRPTYSGLSFNRGWLVRVAYLGSFPFTGSFPVLYEANYF